MDAIDVSLTFETARLCMGVESDGEKCPPTSAASMDGGFAIPDELLLLRQASDVETMDETMEREGKVVA